MRNRLFLNLGVSAALIVSGVAIAPASGASQAPVAVAGVSDSTIALSSVVVARAKASTRVSGWSTTKASAVVGHQFTDRVRVRSGGAFGVRKVLVQRRAAGTRSWTTVTRARTDRAGRFTAILRVPTAERWYFRLRVPATAAAKSHTTKSRRITGIRGALTTISGWTTAPITAELGTRVVSKVRVRTGATYRMRTVQVQRRGPATKAWSVVSTGRTSPSGNYTATLPVLKGAWNYRLRVTATRTAAAGLTPERLVTSTVADTTPPGKVTGLTVGARTPTSIGLSWTNPGDADLARIIVRRATGATAPASSDAGDAVPLSTPTTTTVTDTGLTAGTKYSYAAFTRDTTGNTSAGVTVTTTTTTTPVADTTPPGPVTGLTVGARALTNLTLSWTNPGDADLASIIVRRATGATAPAGSDEGAGVALDSDTATEAMDTGIDPGTEYSYAVFTRDTTGNTSAGVTLTATTTAGPIVARSDAMVLKGTWCLDLDTGIQECYWPPGKDDIWWEHAAEFPTDSQMTPKDFARIAHLGLVDFDGLDAAALSALTYGDTSLNGDENPGPNLLATGHVFAVETTEGNLAKVQVLDYGYDLQVRWVTYRRPGPITTLISQGPGGIASNGDSRWPSISADGRYVSFDSDATTLVTGHTGTESDVFVAATGTGEVALVSVSTGSDPANGVSGCSGISADGQWVAFNSAATNLVDGDTHAQRDIFLRDLRAPATTSISMGRPEGDSTCPRVSGDGRFVSFTSGAALVPEDQGGSDIYLVDRSVTPALTTLVSKASDGTSAAGSSFDSTITGDGRWIAYLSGSSDIVAGDSNPGPDLFVYDRDSGQTELVSKAHDGRQGKSTFNNVGRPAISADGRWVTFRTDASLVDQDTNTVPDVYVWDRDTRQVDLVSGALDGGASNGVAGNPTISADGRWIAFGSAASNLVRGDTNGKRDAFLADRLLLRTRLVSATADGQGANGVVYNATISADGTWLVYDSDATNQVTGDTNGHRDVFLARIG